MHNHKPSVKNNFIVFKIGSERSENEAGQNFSCQTHFDNNPYNLVPTESKQKLYTTNQISIHLFLWCGSSNLT